MFFFLLLFNTCALAAQTADTLTIVADTVPVKQWDVDMALVERLVNCTDTSTLLSATSKPVVNDIQQLTTSKSNPIVFIVLVILLALLTYVKVAFGNQLQDVLRAVGSKQAAQQIFRTQVNEFTLSSLLLHINFVLVVSLYARFIFMRYYHVSSLQEFPTILILIFLFTFFYVAKFVALNVIGVVFEARDVTEEYIFNFSIVCKTLGLALIPTLFIFYTAPEKYFNVIFIVTLIVVFAFTFLFVWRGLSTAYKLLYRSVYHFFIYVCVVEVSPIFLLLKLLTKTVV